VTISLPDDVYRQARIKAAANDTSVSALVREFLLRLAEGETDFDRRKRLQAKTLAAIKRFHAGDRVGRDEVHDRDAVR
jgi:plasmid stability protein